MHWIRLNVQPALWAIARASMVLATPGTGLGLAIVKHIASNHGGAVSVWSAEEIGSTFTLRLPAMDPRVPTAPAPQPDWRKTP